MNAFALALKISDCIGGLKVEYLKELYGNFSVFRCKNIPKKETEEKYRYSTYQSAVPTPMEYFQYPTGAATYGAADAWKFMNQ
uniref:Uncharacterized protein n=1 Tax=Parascaris equorum TaxID=6256 RepID=A0A914RXB5_PAREQ